MGRDSSVFRLYITLLTDPCFLKLREYYLTRSNNQISLSDFVEGAEYIYSDAMYISKKTKENN